MPSPGSPKMWRTPHSSTRVSMRMSAAVVIVYSEKNPSLESCRVARRVAAFELQSQPWTGQVRNKHAVHRFTRSVEQQALDPGVIVEVFHVHRRPRRAAEIR